MKRIISALVCAAIILSLCSCTAKKEKTPSDYDGVVAKLSQTVDALFEKDFEGKLESGGYLSPTGEQQDNWNNMLRDAKADFANVDEKAFGYKVIDINSDSIPELFFVRSDGAVLAVFEMDEGKPELVQCFNRSYRCVVRDSGELYTLTVREDGGYDFRISTLVPASGLAVTVSFGTESNIAYELVNGDIYTTSAERIEELRTQYPFEMSQIFTDLEFYMF